jgi:hypothetical protein
MQGIDRPREPAVSKSPTQVAVGQSEGVLDDLEAGSRLPDGATGQRERGGRWQRGQK